MDLASGILQADDNSKIKQLDRDDRPIDSNWCKEVPFDSWRIQASTLLKGKPLTFEDVHVLHMELLENTSGPIIYEVLKKSEERVGRYV